MTVRPLPLLLSLLLLAACSLLFSLVTGSMETGFRQLADALFGDEPELAGRVILELRWPRAAAAFITGGLLSLALRATAEQARSGLFDVDTVYAALDNHKFGDFSPYLAEVI